MLACASLLVAISAACGGGSNAADSNHGSSTTIHAFEDAQAAPSVSAKMICGDEAQKDIASTIGVTAKVSAPAWNKATRVYSCDYVYPSGARMTLSVKEMVTFNQTTGYFDALGVKLGRGPHLGIAQGAYVTTDGSMVSRKDAKVLLVDISHLPARFGSPAESRAQVAHDVTFVIMRCWTGE
jgi:hypothetical protein